MIRINEGKQMEKIEWYFENPQFHPILLAKNKKELQKAITDYQAHYAGDLKPLLRLLKIKEIKTIKFLPLLLEKITQNGGIIAFDSPEAKKIIITWLKKHKIKYKSWDGEVGVDTDQFGKIFNNEKKVKSFDALIKKLMRVDDWASTDDVTDLYLYIQLKSQYGSEFTDKL